MIPRHCVFSQVLCFALTCLAAQFGLADEFEIHTFKRQKLTGTYFSEGANAGDLNNDGENDVVYGPYWFEGPGFQVKHEIYEPVPQDMNRYADNFFSWVYDFDGDGWKDVFVVGFPGTPAYVYQNPGATPSNQHWQKHQVFDWVSNESPQLIDIHGDERPELVCTRDGFFGFASVNWEKPFESWTFHPVSPQVTATKFGHGLGIGDVNGDGLQDILYPKGWFEQPEQQADQRRWVRHDANLCSGYGGAEMYAYDVDGDGDNDVITSEAAHDFGLAWYENVPTETGREFRRHLIMGQHASENKYGVVFSELHSVALADIDGDGLKDIVTGKTYWSHHRQSPMWDAGAVVYWFKLVRSDQGVDWIPYQADDEAGIGRQLSVVDVDSDGLLDFVVGGMKGAHVLTHGKKSVSKEQWQAAQPKVYVGPKMPSVGDAEARRGDKSVMEKGDRVPHAIEGETLTFTATGGSVKPQDMSRFSGDKWSGKSQLWWTGARPGDELSFDLPAFTGTVDLEVVLTCAKDYGIVQLWLDEQELGKPIDLFESNVVTTGVLSFPKIAVEGKQHRLRVQIAGANPKAVKSFMFALDYLRIRKANGEYVAAKTEPPKNASSQNGIRPKSAEGKTLNLNFENGDLVDWTVTGDAFQGQPVAGDTVGKRRQDMRSNHQGDYWIGGHELHGDGRTGTLTSASFVVSHPYASFLFNGGKQPETRVELIRKGSNEPFIKYSGSDSETMQRVVVDLRAHVGKEIQIRLVDQHRGGWGHINFDDFLLHETRPARPTPAMVELVADEYPHAGLEAHEAAAAMKLPDGFHVTVGAAEPQVKQPIAMAIDDRGRVWIAEAYEYPVRANGDQGRDRILIFEDTNDDGTLDKRTVFAEGLNLVSGLEVGFGGVWIGAAPYLMFIPDRDGDDVPDAKPEILLDGWGYQDTHETLNAFIWGPDGWLYGCHGVFTHSRVGKPGTPDPERIPINAGVWRYHPVRHEFEVFAHGTSNPWGVDFNDHGQAFITACVIPHLYHMIQGARYQRQGGQHFNPYTYRDIVTIADHLHYLGATPHSGNSKSDSAGGGHAHSGAMIYLGDRWPEKYRDQLFMNNIHGQRLNVDVLKRKGSGYVGSHGPDFLLTGDQASQILNLRVGPDGNAWMIDWYDMQACHRREVDRHDRSNGRIYKISYGKDGYSQSPMDLSQATDRELAELVLHKNDWYVRHSRRLLQERAMERSIEPKAVETLRSVALDRSGSTDETRRLRAVWALHVVNETDASFTNQLLQDSHPMVRGWAIQLMMEVHDDQPGPEQLAQLAKIAAEDDSPTVRLYLASAAQRIAPQQRWALIEALTQHPVDAQDHNLPLMYWYAAEPLAAVDPVRALSLAMTAGESIPLLRQFMLRRIGSSGDQQALAILVNALGKAEQEPIQLAYLNAIRNALVGQRTVAAPESWQEVSAKLLKSSSNELKLQAIALGVRFGDEASLQGMRSQVVDRSQPSADRLVALNALLDANDLGLVPTLEKLLRDEPELREQAIRGLAQYDAPQVAPALLSAYVSLTPAQRRMALGTLCSRANSAKALLDAIQQKRIPGTDLTADLVRQLQFLRDKQIEQRLGEVWGVARESAADKLAMIEEYKQWVGDPEMPDPDVELGRAVFAQTCMKCHKLYGQGFKIGPDLTGSNRSNLDYLLSNIVDPSAVMAKEYRPTVIATVDGRVVNGLIVSETDNAITLQTSDSQVTLPKEEIDQRVESTQSMMPEDQLKQFTKHEVRSLIAYLRGTSQNPMLATPQNAMTLFNGKDLSGWSGTDGLWSVEHGEIVGRTSGLPKNEWLISDLTADNFRLTLEVKLVNNEGNSGIQFRSQADDGVVSGYQADIGQGWWGKLYEEHGRKLLWDKSGESYVKPGEWNQYEILAERDHLRTFINGKPCVDLVDMPGAKRGIIAFQLHSGGPTEVRFRNLKLEALTQEMASPTPPVQP